MDWMGTNEWLQKVKGVLVQEGFNDTVLQTIKPGQVFGLVRKLDNVWEMHVRGFNDGRLEAEIEVSRDYFEHLDDDYRRDATLELTQILDTYQIPYRSTGSLPQMGVILYPPKQLRPWKPVAAILGILGLLYWLSKKNN